MGTIIIDKTGEADLSFHSVPLHAVKKATFKDKLGVLHTLVKMVWKSVTYNFNETAQNGAVIFANSYENWDFIAPDNRLSFSGYLNMTLGEVLENMETVLTESPIPAWDKFAEWLGGKGNLANSVLGGVTTTYLITPGGAQTQVNNLTVPELTCFLDLLAALKDCTEPASAQAMSAYAYGSGFQCTLRLVSESSTTDMTFTFRE